ncbi:MAG: MBL fold metallo-hydrolase [Thaumarchaeota archaeon]|nr:MBL fold metallo-hydrolase [Nitrososphaerota archaeon]
MRPEAYALALLAALAVALPAAHAEAMDMDVHVGTAYAQGPPPAGDMAEYRGDNFAFMHPESWAVYDAGVAEWDGWRVPVWAFGSDGQTIDSRIYVAEVPPVIGAGERWDDGVYLARVAANEADFCESGEIAWGRYTCDGYSVVHASHYHYTPWNANYLVVYEWVRDYGGGKRVETTSARLDVPTVSGTLVMYAEAPTPRWESLGLIDAVRSFAPTAGSDFPAPQMQEVAEGVYNYYDGNGSLVVAGGAGVLVTDPANELRAVALREAIAGVTDAPVRWIALTHEHYDHVGGTGGFGDARVICQASCGGIFELSGLMEVPDMVDIEFDEYHEVDVGGISVELHHIAPADGEAATVVYLPAQRVLATADLYAPRELTNAVFITDTNPLGVRKILNEVSSWDVDHALNSHYADNSVRHLRDAAAFYNDLYDAVNPRLLDAQEASGEAGLYMARADLPHEVDLPRYASWDNYEDLPYHVLRMVDAIIHGA